MAEKSSRLDALKGCICFKEFIISTSINGASRSVKDYAFSQVVIVMIEELNYARVIEEKRLA